MDFAQILLVIDKMVATMFAITGALLTGRRVLPLEVRAATSVQKRTIRFAQRSVFNIAQSRSSMTCCVIRWKQNFPSVHSG